MGRPVSHDCLDCLAASFAAALTRAPACRWLELEPVAEGKSDLSLAVYKTDAKVKRLNAVVFKRVKDLSLMHSGGHLRSPPRAIARSLRHCRLPVCRRDGGPRR